MLKGKRKPKVVRLTNSKAIERLDAMTLAIREEAYFASTINAAFQGGNDAIIAFKDSKNSRPAFDGAGCMNTLHTAAIFTLASTLSRLFDEGSSRKHANSRDVASIPLAMRLVRQKRCRDEIAKRARRWFDDALLEEENATDALRAADEAKHRYAALRRSPEGRRTLAVLKTFRDEHLAHRLLPDIEAGRLRDQRSTLGDVWQLLPIACEIADRLGVAVFGQNRNSAEIADAQRHEARMFWDRKIIEHDA